MSVYPLKFEPIFVETVWGGRRLGPQLGKNPPGDESTPIGESWELADFDGARSVVANGPHAGRTLHEVLEEYGEAFLGDLALTPEGGFPLLVKFLDTAAPLSIQVHPTEEAARENPDMGKAKHEAWYVIDAAEDAWIARGFTETVNPETVRRHVETGTIDQIIRRIPTKAGRCHYVPAGTIHAIGPGILLAEIQTPSTTTYRLYDWERTDRELHLDQALRSMRFTPTDVRENERRSHIGGVFTAVSRICDCEHFRIEKVRMAEGYEQAIPYNRPAVWVLLEGAGAITKTPGGVDVPFQRGDVLLLPSGMDDAMVGFNANTAWLEVQFPALIEDELLA